MLNLFLDLSNRAVKTAEITSERRVGQLQKQPLVDRDWHSQIEGHLTRFVRVVGLTRLTYLLRREIDDVEGSTRSDHHRQTMALPRWDSNIRKREPALGAMGRPNPEFPVNVGPCRPGPAHRLAGNVFEVFAIVSDGRALRASCAVSVSDDGPGISDAEKAKVTERFYRGDASRGTPGVGLGLSLVAAVARLHGGSLVLSDNHPGLRATLILAPVLATGRVSANDLAPVRHAVPDSGSATSDTLPAPASV